MSAANKLFGPAAFYLSVIDTIAPIALNYEYNFVSDEWFTEWRKTEEFTVDRLNVILAVELIDKAHLAAITALMRAKRGGPALRDSSAAWLRWILGSITPPISPR